MYSSTQISIDTDIHRQRDQSTQRSIDKGINQHRLPSTRDLSLRRFINRGPHRNVDPSMQGPFSRADCVLVSGLHRTPLYLNHTIELRIEMSVSFFFSFFFLERERKSISSVMAKTSKVSVYVLRRPARRSRLSYTWKLGGNPTWAGSTTESTQISVGSRCSNSQETTALSPHSLKDDAGKAGRACRPEQANPAKDRRNAFGGRFCTPSF